LQQNNIVQQQYVRADTGASHSRAPPHQPGGESRPEVGTDRHRPRSPRRPDERPVARPAFSTETLPIPVAVHFIWRDARKTRHLLFSPRKPIRRAAVAASHNGALDIALGGINIYICENVRFIILFGATHYIHANGYLLQLSSCKFENFSSSRAGLAFFVTKK